MSGCAAGPLFCWPSPWPGRRSSISAIARLGSAGPTRSATCRWRWTSPATGRSPIAFCWQSRQQRGDCRLDRHCQSATGCRVDRTQRSPVTRSAFHFCWQRDTFWAAKGRCGWSLHCWPWPPWVQRGRWPRCFSARKHLAGAGPSARSLLGSWPRPTRRCGWPSCLCPTCPPSSFPRWRWPSPWRRSTGDGWCSPRSVGQRWVWPIWCVTLR